MVTREIILFGIGEISSAVGVFLSHIRPIAEAEASSIWKLQEHLTGKRFYTEPLILKRIKTFASDTAHRCSGRSLSHRLARAFKHTDRFNRDLPTLKGIADKSREVA